MSRSTTIALVLCLLATNAHAQVDERGLLFTIGEKIMNLSGFSYLELEKRIAKSEKAQSECLVEVAQVKLQHDKKDEELKACQAGSAAATELPTTP